MNKKGFTLIELLAVIVILAIILAIAIPSISGIIKNSTMSSMKSDAKLVLKAIELKKLGNSDFNPLSYNGDIAGLLSALNLNNQNYESIALIEHEGKLFITVTGKNKWTGLTACGTYHNMSAKEGECELDFVSPVITLVGDNFMTITLGSTYTEQGSTALDNKDGDITSKITMTGSVNTSIAGEYTITYTVKDNNGNTATIQRTIKVIRPYNPPLLAKGMTAIKWVGAVEQTVSNPDTDTSWYNYANQEWANAKTVDGSYWVWIPRYAYQIATNYHKETAGTINVKFLQDTTDKDYDGNIVAIAPTYSVSSQTNYIKHPAFTFGTTELTGIWVAKFEMSGTTLALDSKPGVDSLRDTTVKNMFIASRNMETNSRYGWDLASGIKTDGTFTTDTNNVDTHMIKNIEWGVVAYLSQSSFGKYGNTMYTGTNKEIYQNKSSTYITGSSNGTPSQSTTNTQCTYNELTDRGSGTGSCGGGASTTGNIYGIYDMSGGTQEYVMGNYNNAAGGSGLAPSNINNKYIDRYPTGYVSTIYGDAVYETSKLSTGANSWYVDYSNMPITNTDPWFYRGGGHSSDVTAGIFSFFGNIGSAHNSDGFRVVVLVGAGL